mgnify:CR=1 FL=1
MRVTSLNVAGVAAALAVPLAFGAVDASRARASAEATSAAPRGAEDQPLVEESERGPVVRDARGRLVAVAPYRRVLFLSPVGARLGLELLEPDRIAGVPEYAATQGLARHRFASVVTLPDAPSLEAVLAAAPDLVVTHAGIAPNWLDVLESRGVPVLDLGQMTGAISYAHQSRLLAAAAAVASRGDRHAATYLAGLNGLLRVRGGSPEATETLRTAVYVGVVGDTMFGGTTGTSYHDVLVHAGLRDAAADSYTGWPQFDAGDLLAMDPDVVVVERGAGRQLCAIGALAALRACRGQALVVELDGDALHDPGAGIPIAAHALRTALLAHGATSAAGYTDQR